MGCCESLVKTFMFLFNTVFFLCGAALLAIGIWIVVDKSSLLGFVSDAGASDLSTLLNTSVINSAAYILIAVGAITFVVGFCGCCGACKESVCLLRSYAVLVGVLLILEIIGVILAAVFSDDIEASLQNSFIKVQNDSYVGLPNGTDDPDSLSLDIMMVDMKCCGITGPQDFMQLNATNAHKWYTTTRITEDPKLKIPYSCCKLKSTEFMKEGTYNQIKENRENPNCGPRLVDYYDTGCFKQVEDSLMQYATVIIAVAIIVVLIEILGIVITCCLIRSYDD